MLSVMSDPLPLPGYRTRRSQARTTVGSWWVSVRALAAVNGPLARQLQELLALSAL
jgi:hypothetical protein